MDFIPFFTSSLFITLERLDEIIQTNSSLSLGPFRLIDHPLAS